MGNGIAHVFARSGLNVRLCEVEQRFLDRGLETIRKNLAREVAKAKSTQQEMDASLERIEGTLDRSTLAGCDFVIEAATEKFEIKRQIFAELDGLLSDHVILASNTSSISITKLAAQTKRPDQVIGMHFFNPVPVMKLVEVIRGLATSQASYDTVRALAERLGKTPVEVNDAPGFVSNRVLMPLLNVRGDGRSCDSGSHRRGLQTGHGPSDGPAHARRLHWPRCLPRYHARPRRRTRRSEVPALPAADPHGRRWLAGTQERARLL
jgi:3-hydroxybutyryl-CoA dehydrogenase